MSKRPKKSYASKYFQDIAYEKNKVVKNGHDKKLRSIMLKIQSTETKNETGNSKKVIFFLITHTPPSQQRICMRVTRNSNMNEE